MPWDQVFKQPFFLNSFTRFEAALWQNWKAAYLASGLILRSWSVLRLLPDPAHLMLPAKVTGNRVLSEAFFPLQLNSIIERSTAFMQKLTSLKDLLFLIQFLVSSWQFWAYISLCACMCMHPCPHMHACLCLEVETVFDWTQSSLTLQGWLPLNSRDPPAFLPSAGAADGWKLYFFVWMLGIETFTFSQQMIHCLSHL